VTASSARSLPQTVAITGAAGFIGAHLAATLRDAGCHVVGLARRPIDMTGVEARRVELLEPPSIADGIRECDAVVHLAATNKWTRDGRAQAELTNVTGTRNLLAAMRASDVEHLVFPSTGKVYRSGAKLPIDEDESCVPSTELGRQKLAGEQLIREAVEDGSPESATILRIFNAYGPGQGTDFLIPRIIDHLDRGQIDLGDPEVRRDFVHVTDIVSAIVAVLRAPPERVAVLNVGTGHATSVAEVVAAIGSLTGIELSVEMDGRQVRAGEPAAECGAIDRIQALGWGPPMELAEGLATMAPSHEPH
jgi:nucleoside-diphosphate-sugar epimerase